MLLETTKNQVCNSGSLQFLGAGWQRKLLPRKTGSRCDVNIISPEGKRFREYSRLAAYLKKNQSRVLKEKEVEQLRQLFRMDALNTAVKKSVNKTQVICEPTNSNIKISKKERKILPKNSDLTKSHPMQEQLLKLNSSQFLLEEVPRLPQEKPQLIFLSPRPTPTTEEVQMTETIILEPEWLNKNSRTNFHEPDLYHHKEIEKQSVDELKSCVVASPNMFISSDLNVLVDTELELTCDTADMEMEDDMSHLCVHDLSYFDDFVLSKPKGDMNLSEEKTEEHCDHSYIGKMSELEILDLYYNFDIQMSEEMLQRMIEVTKHLYEHLD